MPRKLAFAAFALFAVATLLWPQANVIYVCPMDPDVRSHDPGTCPRCGMKLASGLPEPVEYHMNAVTTPRAIEPGQPFRLTFDIRDPWKDRPVTGFQIVHEKLFHMFVVSQDLEFFLHDHPVFTPSGEFRFDNLVLPKPGMYRVLGDFYPSGATPQLLAKTLILPGPASEQRTLAPDYSAKDTENLRVEMTTVPGKPIAALNTQLHFRVTPGDGIEQYLGAWGHMLVASDDLVDLIHAHPFIADGSNEIQFNVTFPRPGHGYRVWVQFQRAGVVNTARFDIQASDLH